MLSTVATMSRDVSHGTLRTLAMPTAHAGGALATRHALGPWVLQFPHLSRCYGSDRITGGTTHPVSPQKGLARGPAEGDCPDHDEEGSAVTTKSAFTEDEWSRIVRAPMAVSYTHLTLPTTPYV